MASAATRFGPAGSVFRWSAVRRAGRAASVALLTVALGSACGSSAGRPTTSAPVAAAGDLSRFLLSAGQVGPGYQLRVRPDGRGVVGFVTLDLCGAAFASEGRRIDRVQVNYAGPSGIPALSNEIVSYRAGGARQALEEILQAVRSCPSGPTRSNVAGVGRLVYRVMRFDDARLAPGAIPLAIHVTGTVQGRHLDATTVVVYQAHGDLLSGVYGQSGPVEAQKALVVRAATRSAIDLGHP